MNQTSPVVIVSAFGRGNTLAQTLASQGLPIHLIDVSPFLGETKIEDDEGPFGFFSQGLTSIETQRLMFDHPAQLQEAGFTFMLPDGPFELKGALATHRQQQLSIPEKVWSWVVGSRLILNSDQAYILNEDFDQTWLFHLTRSFNSNQWVPNYRAGLVEGGMAFTGDFYVRSVDRNVSEDALKVLESNGVKVTSKTEVLDVALNSAGTIKSLEIRAKDSGTSSLVELDHLVWFLSGEETEKISDKAKDKVFPKGILRPLGSWNRARVRISESSQRESLPLHSVWIQNRALPWTHENMFVLQRTVNSELFDIWFRTPESFRFLKDYILRLVEAVVQTLEGRLGIDPGQITLAEAPLSTQKNSNELGPSRHPLYDSREWLETRGSSFKNFHWLSSETLAGLGWNFQIQKSRQIQENLLEWWKIREALREKKELEMKKIADREKARKGVDRD